MSTVINLKEIERRANYAAFQDGLMEIAMGLFLFFWGGALFIDTTSLALIFSVLVLVFGKQVLERIKQRFIYPRAGYVKLPEDPHKSGKGIAITVLIFIIFLLGAMVVSILVMGQDSGLEFFLTYIVPPASGFMLAIGPYWLGQTYGLVRGYVWAALFLFGGIAFPILGIASGYQAVGLLCTVIGLLILVTGTVMFVRFIRRYPVGDQEVVLNGG